MTGVLKDADPLPITPRKLEMDTSHAHVGRSGRCSALLCQTPPAISKLRMHIRPHRHAGGTQTRVAEPSYPLIINRAVNTLI